MNKHIRLFIAFNKYSILRWMEHRVDFFLRIIPAAIGITTNIVGILLVFNFISVLAGWTRDEIILLTGVFYLVKGIYFSMFIKNVSRIGEYVNSGSLDYVLLKPVNSLFTVSFINGVNWGESMGIPSGLIIIPIAIHRLNLDLYVWQVVGFVLMLVCSVVLAYSVWTITMTTSFWLGRIRGFHEIFISLFQMNRYPVEMFPSYLRRMLLSVLPLGIMVWVPTKFLLHDFGWEWVFYSVFAASLSLIVTSVFWKVGLKYYSSASS